jgi:hypothetical protein
MVSRVSLQGLYGRAQECLKIALTVSEEHFLAEHVYLSRLSLRVLLKLDIGSFIIIDKTHD